MASPARRPSTAIDAGAPVVRVRGVSLRYGTTLALDDLSLDLPGQCMVGLIGPDGVGKSSLIALLSGARKMQAGRLDVLGGDIADAAHRRALCPRIAYMPQGLGKNLYPSLSVFENVDCFGRWFGQPAAERRRRIAELLDSTGLAPFRDRPAGQLSGGMKQKLGLCCALIHDPDLLVLDEPTTGVDPLSRAQFWALIARLRQRHPGMSVLVSTAYMDEAERFDWLVAMDAGRVLATGTAAALRQQTGADSLESAFIRLLPEAKRRGYRAVVIPPRGGDGRDIAIEAQGLSKRFGAFTAVDRISLRIERGEIFGFLGSNGCGKSTTMKMLTGLLPPSAGQARLFGRPVDANDMAVRRRVGYMSQAFSLYAELSVRQNLELHARLFHLPAAEIPGRVAEMARRFALDTAMDSLPDALPLGLRQRLSLAVAVIHRPELLILDEPTSGVDPVARDGFWELIVDLARREQVTVFISTHFMNEAERCDRISLMHAGKILASGAPAELLRRSGQATLEQAFIAYLQQAGGADGPRNSHFDQKSRHPGRECRGPWPRMVQTTHPSTIPGHGFRHSLPERRAFFPSPSQCKPFSRLFFRRTENCCDGQSVQPQGNPPCFSLRRLFSLSRRETLELRRDPLRISIALFGTLFLMLTFGYGITLDVENLRFAVLDRDQTTLSHNYALNLGGSRYFIAQPPIADYDELDRRLRSGELSLALEIPPHFAREVQRGGQAAIGAWIDGAMPSRAETILGYAQAMHQSWLHEQARRQGLAEAPELFGLETRFRYNPDVKSLPAMVPSIIPLLLLLIPAMLSALGVVREKELGSILNLYVTPVTRLEFLLGKQLPYIAVGMANFLLLYALAVWVFAIPFKGNFLLLALAALLYAAFASGFGLLISAFTRSQIAAVFATFLAAFIPSTRLSGMIDPVSSLEGPARWLGDIFPGTHFLVICRGTFSKALGFAELGAYLLPMGLAIAIVVGLSAALLDKQEH